MSLSQHNTSKIFQICETPKEGSLDSSIQGKYSASSLFNEYLDGDAILTPDIAKQDIQFHDVWFKYPTLNSKWVLRNFNLTIKAGESVGIKGESGSGKSTLIQLLLRFYDPQYGYISIDGISIRQFTIKSLRECFGLVQQEPVIFSCSIMDNILYGKSHANAQEIKEAADTANATEFIHQVDERKDEDNSENTDHRVDLLHPGFRMTVRKSRKQTVRWTEAANCHCQSHHSQPKCVVAG